MPTYLPSALFALLGCAIFASSVSACAPQQEPVDRILHNGVVYTVDQRQPEAQAIAIRGESIVAVGSDSQILALQSEATEVIDLQGQFVLPGFNDTHVHFSSAAQFLEFNIMAVADQSTFVQRVRRLVESLPEGEWITGGLWGAYDQWALGSAGGESRQAFAPDMRLVEEISSRHPIFIRKFDGSEFAANRAALQAAGIEPSAEVPQAGIELVLDEQGGFTGRLRGPAVLARFRPVLPGEFSYQRRMAQTQHAMQIATRFGVTSLSDMSDDRQLRIYRQLHDQGELTLRVHYRYPLERWPELAGQGIRVGSGDHWIRLGGLKGHIDGIMGTSSARFFEPYNSDPTNRGSWRPLMVDQEGDFVEGKFLKYMLGADRAGLQLTVHAIGDEANQVLLNYLEEVVKQNGERDRRFRLVHAQVLADEDFPRLGELGVLAEVQPFHLSDDMRWMELRIGQRRCRNAYAFRRMQENGAQLCFGSDWPGTSAAEYPINPLLAIYAATSRQTISGQPAGGWFPDERIDIETALRAHTLNGAYSTFEEHLKGSLTPGKLADVVVLDSDLRRIEPSGILNARVVYTIVGGKVVFRANSAGDR